MTQRQIGEAVGVRSQQIQKYECGQNRVSAARLFLLSQALDVPVEYFFSDLAQRPSASASANHQEEAPEAKKLTHALLGMGAKPRRQLLLLAQSLAK